jgi:hypothetical protein
MSITAGAKRQGQGADEPLGVSHASASDTQPGLGGSEGHTCEMVNSAPRLPVQHQHRRGLTGRTNLSDGVR